MAAEYDKDELKRIWPEIYLTRDLVQKVANVHHEGNTVKAVQAIRKQFQDADAEMLASMTAEIEPAHAEWLATEEQRAADKANKPDPKAEAKAEKARLADEKKAAKAAEAEAKKTEKAAAAEAKKAEREAAALAKKQEADDKKAAAAAESAAAGTGVSDALTAAGHIGGTEAFEDPTDDEDETEEAEDEE